jgi:thioredoxin-dependent peroxiredoxin
MTTLFVCLQLLLVTIAGLVSSCGATQRPDGGTGPLTQDTTVARLTAIDQRGGTVSVGGETRELTVVYFYPKDGTPGCTAEACAFRDVWQQYKAANVRVIGVSNDDSQSHATFAKEQRLPFSLVADTDGTWASHFGVASFAGFYARTTFLLGAHGVVLKTYRDVDPGLHAKEILADARAFQTLKAETSPTTAVARHPTDPLAPAPRLPTPTAPSVHLQLQASAVAETEDGRREFWLGATLTPPPGSHLYWKHAGEVGLPTRVEFSGPRGLHIGEAQYPGPKRFTTEHDQVTYAYDSPVTIVARVTSEGPIEDGVLYVFGTWLSCDVRCVKEQGTANVTASRGTFSSPLTTLRAALQRLAKPGSTVGLTTSFDPVTRVLRVESAADQALQLLEVFPEQDLGADDRAPERLGEGLAAAAWKWHSSTVPRALTVLALQNQQEIYYRILR